MRDRVFSKKFIKDYVYSQAHKKPGWVAKQVKAKRMGVRMANTLEMIIPALERVYPGQWDIQFLLDCEHRTVKNQYALVDFAQDWYDYLIFKATRGSGRNEEDLLNEEEFSEYLRHNPYLRSSYLHDCYPLQSETMFDVPKRFIFNSFKVYIHFPEVTIRNSRSQSITVRDLFFRFNFDGIGAMKDGLEGSKSTFTTDEFESGYMHSHIPSLQMYNQDASDRRKTRLPFQSVCLGAGEMKPMMLNYRLDPNQEDFEMMLHMLKTVASWESIEGVPHARMENVISKQIGAPNLHWQHGDQVFRTIITKSNRINHNLDWYYTNGQYSIVDNEKFEDFCIAAYDKIPFDYMVHKDETGAYYVPNRVTLDDMQPNEPDYIVCLGKKFELKVEGELRLSGERKKYINPNIKSYVKRKLEITANQIQIKADSISRLHKINNNEGVSRSCEIPV